MATPQTLVGTVVTVRRTIDGEQVAGEPEARRTVTGQIVAHFDEAATGVRSLTLQVDGERNVAAYRPGQTVRLVFDDGVERPADPPSPYTRLNSDLE